MSRRPKRERGRRPQAPAPGPAPATSRGGSVRWTRWLAYAAIALYGVFWGTQAFTLHRTGNYAVETDFYWKYAPAADDLRHGRLNVENYDSKGWGYPAALALLSLTGLDTFRAGQILALLAACLSAWLVYRIQRSLFGPTLALLGLLVLLSNETFVLNTFEVGTDMFFFTLCAASIALLLRPRAPGIGAVAASGLLAGWAFSTRYNGLFLLAGAVLQLLFLREPRGERRERWLRVAAVTGGFLLGALPWLVMNTLLTGNPLTNSNYMNVGYLVYGEGHWDKFFYGKERVIHSFLDVVRRDPGRFVLAVARNTVETIRRDLTVLLPPVWGACAVLGTVLTVRERPGRRAAAFFLFGALYFITITPVFYGARFSLPTLAFYTALVAWPFATERAGARLASLERTFPLRSFIFLLLWLPATFTTVSRIHDPRNPEGIMAGSPRMDAAVEFLKTHARGEALVARKPHTAYRAGMRFVPLADARSIEDLRDLMRRKQARYLLISGWEVGPRRAFRPFADPDAPHPGFRLLFDSEEAMVYEALQDSVPAAPAAPP